jgi:SOS response regulatory protein OraA/RecX
VANYISRYAPSEKKLREYLTKKHCQNIDTLLIEYGYSEVMMMSLWIRTFLSTGTALSVARRKLFMKGFPKELIETTLLEVGEEFKDWSTISWAVTARMKTLQSRGKSKSHIRMELVQVYPYFRDEIDGLISEMDEFSNLREQIDKYLQKYNIRIPAENKKFYDALLRKGFHYGDIKKLLSSENG